VFGFKAIKAPGLDGVTVDAVCLCWHFVGDLCYKAVKAFWNDFITSLDSGSVIKLIHKGSQRDLLTNWRPVSLVTIMYKIVAKLIAGGLKLVIPRLVEAQQKGFVSGRLIQDNILGFKLAQEFVKDRKLVQGLALGTTKIHFNGIFTDAIPLCRGVKQGCPAAPGLFALSTQPSMLLLNNAARAGDIEGIQIGEDRRLLHQLFADDMGLFLMTSQANFRKVKEIIDLYERISGAQLNLGKSLILPLRACPTPAWFEEVGCQIAKSGEIFKYLGAPIAINLSSDAEQEFLLDKGRKKLRHWSHKLVTMTGRMVYLKHILCSVPCTI
jgi:hypothetical protein